MSDSAVMTLGQKDEWLPLQYGDKRFTIELADAYDLLIESDRHHRDDALECPVCGLPVGFSARAEGDPPLSCGCTEKGAYFTYSGKLLDTMAGLIKQRFDLENVSRNMAREFRTFVLQRYEEAKKKSATPPESDIGMESTPEAGVR